MSARALAVALLGVVGCTRAGFTPMQARDGSAASAWVALGESASDLGISGRKTTAGTARIAVAAGDVPFVAWADDSTGTRQVYLKRWDGASWVGLGGSDQGGGVSATADESRLGALVIDASGRPALTWAERGSSGSGVYFRRWSGTSWEEVSGSTTGKGISGLGTVWWPTMVLDSSGRSTVMWEAYAVQTYGVVYLKQLTATGWAEVAGSASNAGLCSGAGASYLSTLAAGPSGALHAAWQEEPSPAETPAAIMYRGYDGAAWRPIETISTTGEDSRVPEILVDAAHNPVVVWQAEVGGAKSVRLRRWTGTSWQGFGGSDSGAGISASTGQGRHPTATLDADGRLVVAWEADDSLGTNIYVRRWDGVAWIDPIAATAPGGVSATRRTATYPSLAAGSSGIYVIWEQTLQDGSVAIYLRHLPR
jgi:hypothetical protein